MRCPHLLNWTVSSCVADDKPYVPSLFELQQYCTDKGHDRCPLYVGLAREGQDAFSGAIVEERDLPLRGDTIFSERLTD
jgi:hypothetical protein